MHLGVLTTSYPRTPDDPAGNFVAGLNRYLLSQGHTVEVIAAGEAPPAGPAPAPHQAQDGTWRIPSSLFYRGGAPEQVAQMARLMRPPHAALSPALRFTLALYRRCRQRAQAFDALVSHWVLPCGVAGALAAPATPHLAIAHSSDIHLARRLRAGALLGWLHRRADLVYTARSLILPGAPGRVVPMGVDAAAFAPSAPDERSAARRALGLRPGPPAILFLGRLVPVKGVDVLLCALGLLPQGDLLIAGDGPLRGALQRRAAPLGRRVRFLGEVRGLSRRELLLGCDVLVLPSLALPDGRTEGAPTVLLESLCAGLPVVASAVGGVADLVGDAGVLVPPGQPGALAAALERACHPAWLAAAGARASGRGHLYDWSQVGPTLLGGVLQAASARLANAGSVSRVGQMFEVPRSIAPVDHSS